MSFSFNFVSAPSDVPALLELNTSAKTAPAFVKAFIVQAAAGVQTELVSISASGHLYDGPGSSPFSSVNIEVKPITVVKPQ